MSWLDRIRPGPGGRKPNANGATAAVAPPSPVARRGVSKPGAEPFPRFHATASDQLDASLKHQMAGARLKLRDAFTPSQPITERGRFAGRTAVLAGIIGAIEDGRLHTVIYGVRGIGKTSLLHILAQAAGEAKYQVVYISCGATSQFDEFFRMVAGHVPLLFHADYGPTSPEAERGETLADILPATPVSVRQASDVCAKIAGTRALVLLDEFDRADSVEFRRNIAEFVKSLSDRTIRLQLVIAGVAQDLSEIIAEIPSIQRNVYGVEAPPMAPKEIRELVAKGGELSQLDFADGAVRCIIDCSSGLPYLASLLAHHAGLHALDAGRQTVTEDDVLAAVGAALDGLRARMPRQVQTQLAALALAPETAHAILGPLGRAAQLGGGELTADDVAEALPAPQTRALGLKLLERLSQCEGIVERVNNGPGCPGYRFIDPSAAPYLWLLSAKARFGSAREHVARGEAAPLSQAAPSDAPSAISMSS